MKNFRLKPTRTIILAMPDGQRMRVVAADQSTMRAKVIRLSDGMPLTVCAIELGLKFPNA